MRAIRQVFASPAGKAARLVRQTWRSAGLWLALAVSVMAPLCAAAPAPAPDPGFAAFIAALRPDAEARGVSRATFDAAFRGVTAPDAVAVGRTRTQSEFVRPVWDYLVGAVSSGRLSRGRAQAAVQAGTLAAIEARYGVPRAVVLAVWGVESDFGASAGSTSVIRSLASLAYAGHRGTLFRDELLTALTIIEKGDVSPEAMKGSWAGAMGQAQFLPSSFVKFAVDFDGDGRRDIWTSAPDALASIANFLERQGWQRALPWGLEVSLPNGFDLARYDDDLASFASRGVSRTDGQAMPRDGRASLFLPGGLGAPAFLITDNFEVLRAYNTSDSYALAIGHLADRLAGGPALSAPWPGGAARIDRSGLQRIQRGLAAAGFYAGDIDGRAGPKLREAIRRYQIAKEMTADGYASPAFLAALGAAGNR